MWPRAPDKVLGLRADWAAAAPDRLGALVRALSAAAAWIDQADHRAELVSLLAEPRRVGVEPALVTAGLADIAFAGAAVNTPSEADADWLVGQMAHWGQLDSTAGAAAARRTFRRDLFEAAVGAPSA
jgi:ABC-type nitrate/sulfonate/bicarbonate transport system substrate-binding protein